MKTLFVAAATSAFAAAGLTAIARSPISAAASGTPAYVKGALRSGISDDSPGMGHIGILLSLRNESALACALPKWLFLAFRTSGNASCRE